MLRPAAQSRHTFTPQAFGSNVSRTEAPRGIGDQGTRPGEFPIRPLSLPSEIKCNPLGRHGCVGVAEGENERGLQECRKGLGFRLIELLPGHGNRGHLPAGRNQGLATVRRHSLLASHPLSTLARPRPGGCLPFPCTSCHPQAKCPEPGPMEWRRHPQAHTVAQQDLPTLLGVHLVLRHIATASGTATGQGPWRSSCTLPDLR